MSAENDINSWIQTVGDEYEADILVYAGPIARVWDDHLISIVRTRERKKNVLLILTTLGGDPHAAYRMARVLRDCYAKNGKVIIFVSSVCASAGTLMTLAADSLILSPHAELGPLDMQMRKPEEVGERTSGLTPIQAINFLEKSTTSFFRSQFTALRFDRSLSFSTKMAADVAAHLATGMMSNLYEQIDPLRLAEYDRAMRVASEYGERIKSPNVKPHTIKHLLEEYPAHEFCIDPLEAVSLFHKIDTPSASLELLGARIKEWASPALGAEDPKVFFCESNTTTSPTNENTDIAPDIAGGDNVSANSKDPKPTSTSDKSKRRPIHKSAS